MASTPPPMVGEAGSLTVSVTPPPVAPSPASPSSPEGEAETPRSEFSTPPTSPRAVESPASPPPPPREQAAAPPLSPATGAASSPMPADTFSTPPLVRTVSPPLPAAKLPRPDPVQVPPQFEVKISGPPPVQVPPPQFEKAAAGPDGSVVAFFWDAVARVQQAHASLDEYISNWLGLDQSKYQWALNDYYECAGKSEGDGFWRS
ncbi:hypothetical protein ACP70R_022652 [Stipagrostis hirtigluma subsp. patula]